MVTPAESELMHVISDQIIKVCQKFTLNLHNNSPESC